jgi:predicted dehydrogenase
VTTRRDFLATSAALAATTATPLARLDAAPAPDGLFRAPPLEKVRVAFVGVGEQGKTHVDNLLSLEGVELVAICDIVEERAKKEAEKVVAKGQPAPVLYTRGPTDFRRMCDEVQADIVYNATPWEWHVPVMLAAMQSGKHVATEVPAAMTVDDCWKLVEAAERTQRHCVMLENCCYDRFEMMTLNLVRKGLLGELLYAEAGYQHDLRKIKFADESEGLWRREWSKEHNGNLYPTHGFGPVAQCLDINRGNQLDALVSFSTKQRGLSLYAEEHFPETSPKRREQYKLGDVNVSLITTQSGQTIVLKHNTSNPRPYSRSVIVQGTRGIAEGWPQRVHIEGRSAEHKWDAIEAYFAEFEHPLWKMDEVKNATRGHGGMDWLESYRLVECLKRGEPTDMDVYDAAAWSCLVELSERSVAQGGKPQRIPDFTRGKWRARPPLPIIGTRRDGRS